VGKMQDVLSAGYAVRGGEEGKGYTNLLTGEQAAGMGGPIIAQAGKASLYPGKNK